MKYCFYILMINLFFITACRRDTKSIANYTPIDPSLAYLKIVHASPNFRQVFNTRDTFNVFVGAQKVNAPFLTYNSVYPFAVSTSSASITATYMGITAGQQDIKLSVPGLGTPDSAAIITLNKNLQAGKYYTLFITDSIKSPNDTSQIFMQDIFPPTLTGYLNLRFVHAVLNDTFGKSVDVFSYARNAVLFSNIRPGKVTNFSLLNYNASVADTLYITRPLPPNTPATTPLSQRVVLAKLGLTTTVMGTGAMDRRSFTLYYKGDANLSTGTKSRSLSIYINQ